MGRWNDHVPGVDAWAKLIPHLPEPLRAQACREALRLASSIDDTVERLLACATQAGALGGEAVAELLRSLKAMDGFAGGRALRMLVPHLPAHLLPDAVEVAMTVDATERFAGEALRSPRADVLTALAPRLHGALRDRALEAARAATAEIDEADSRNEATLRVAVAFSATDLATADVREAVTQRIRDAGPVPWRDELVRAVEPFLPADLVAQVRAERRAADRRRAERVDALLVSARSRDGAGLEAPTLHAALEAARGIDADELRATALGRLAPHLNLMLQQPYSRKTETEEEVARRRVQVLKALAPHLSHEQLPGALGTTLNLIARGSMWSLGFNGLALLARPLGTLPRQRLYPLWRRTLHAVAPLHRVATLRHLGDLGPVVIALRGQAGAGALVRAVKETGDWWP